MQAVVAAIRTSARAQLRTADVHGVAALDRLFDVYFGGVRDHDANARAMYVILVEGLTATPGLRPAVAETNALTRASIAEAVRAAAAADGPAIDAEAAAVLIEGILRGVALQYLAAPDAVDLDGAVTLAKRLVRTLLLTELPTG